MKFLVFAAFLAVVTTAPAKPIENEGVEPVAVHQHYHHAAPPAVLPYSLPPKASVYRPPLPTYGTPVPNYSGPMSPYAPSLASSYGAAPPGAFNGFKGAAATGYGYGHQVAATGYDSVTVQAAGPNGYTFRDSSTSSSSSSSSSSNNGADRRPKAVGSGVRFGATEQSSTGGSGNNEADSSPSAMRFETAKRKRSPKPQDYASEQQSTADSESVTIDEATDPRQLGSNSLPTCSYNQVCCRTAVTNGYTGGVAPEAEFAECPWQAAILKKDQYDNVYICGGALVGPSHILTGAHCIKGLAPNELRVRLGQWDVNREPEFYPQVEKDVVSVIIHPEYYPGNLYNDVAVIKFEGAVDFAYNPHIAPASLTQRYQEFGGTRCWVTGWGKDSFGTDGRYQNILKEVDLPVVDNVSCENKLKRTRLGYEFNLRSGFLGAGGEEGKDACKGDGGGPLVCESQGSWFLAGLVSWGIGCGSPDVPGVYVKVSEYSDWVQRNLAF